MTNKPMLSVERELLERAASAIEKHHGSLQWVIASELRALLDKEVDGNSRAPKQQGEPVAQSEFEPDAICLESDGCPTEVARLNGVRVKNEFTE